MSKKDKKRFPLKSPSLAFFLCLFIAIFGWISVNLSKDYTKKMAFHISVTDVPDYTKSVKLSDSTIQVAITMSGFSFLQHSFTDIQDSLVLSASHVLEGKDKTGVISISSQELQHFLDNQQCEILRYAQIETPEVLRMYVKY